MNLITAERKYYRLDELKSLGIAEGTLRYLIEQDNLQPVFFLPSKQYVLGGYHENKFKGFAIAQYKGIVSIPAPKLAHLLSKGKVSSVEMNLLEREKITVISSYYSFDVPLPNSYIASWLKADLAQFNWPAIPAKSCPMECDSPMSSFLGMLKAVNAESKSAVKDSVLESKIFENYPKRILSAEGQNFKFEDICIQTTDLIRLGLLNHQTESSSEVLNKPNIDKTAPALDKFQNEFEELIARILIAKPLIQAKELHRLLCDEAAKEEDSRAFDLNNVLLSETYGVISWRDKYRDNSERSYRLDSVRNVISRVRGKLRK
jgi:hypothetical protein